MNTVEAESAFINSSAIAYTTKEKVPQPDGSCTLPLCYSSNLKSFFLSLMILSEILARQSGVLQFSCRLFAVAISEAYDATAADVLCLFTFFNHYAKKAIECTR
ncbi:hypothetical protein NSR00_15845 [Aeribacillus sp. FSL K6-8394]|uniref:hypothetical protein n=1 Tax=Aeribacillus sp. FSL K6-8394 TaxID=2954570 RepID=UPI0030F67FC6